MQAVTVAPGDRRSAGVEEIGEPPEHDGSVLVEGLFIGICGTDAEIVAAGYGQPPAGHERLVLGHESLGRVLEAPKGSGLAAGDLVAGIVRRPDPEPCACCAQQEWDMCRNGGYVERGIKGRDGYGSQRWRVDPEFAVPVDAALGDLGVLLEPTSVVAKAWEQVERIGARACYQPSTVVVTGAGPIGLLAALLGVQRGLDVHVVDRVTDGPKPALVRDLGATYHSEPIDKIGVAADVAIECTGIGQLVFGLVAGAAPNAVICLAGLAAGSEQTPTALDAVNRGLVLGNQVLFGSVNAARRHYEQAADALAAADAGWLGRVVSRRVPMADWPSALDRQPDDVKVVVDLTA
ncbi:MAG: glucose 1-dehydrogenase [Actinomycetota bacterium]|nr:glucose 1-dehydrogenase [Actinomycetota bacterium]